MKKGFTLVEVLLVIVIIAVLTAIVLVAINPARQVAQANNTQRRADVTTILNAVSEYMVDNGGTLPTSTEAALGAAATNMGSAAADVEICTDLVPTYLAALPFDPSASGAGYTDCTDYDLQYNVSVDANDRVTVAAPNAQLSETISVSR
jgi:type IV pilus assembly protein PilA